MAHARLRLDHCFDSVDRQWFLRLLAADIEKHAKPVPPPDVAAIIAERMRKADDRCTELTATL